MYELFLMNENTIKEQWYNTFNCKTTITTAITQKTHTSYCRFKPLKVL